MVIERENERESWVIVCECIAHAIGRVDRTSSEAMPARCE
jgi:hypothetical protein